MAGSQHRPDWLTPDPHERGGTSSSSSSSSSHHQSTRGIDDSSREGAALTGRNNNNESSFSQQRKSWTEVCRGIIKKDGRLILITILIIVLMNIPIFRWILYPFTIFSTWIHESCHGMAAILSGGHIKKLEIFPDGSGLATTTLPNNRLDRRGFVVSAGYQGTAVIGCILLMCRRTKRGPRFGTLAVAIMLILSVCLWIRNIFGIVFISIMGAVLGLAAIQLSATHIRNLYVCMAITCALNAIGSARNLYRSQHQVNGNDASTDAIHMTEVTGGTAFLWATFWIVFAFFMMICGIVFAIPGPNEVADFAICRMCQNCGLFTICNPDSDPDSESSSPRSKGFFFGWFGKQRPRDDNLTTMPTITTTTTTTITRDANGKLSQVI